MSIHDSFLHNFKNALNVNRISLFLLHQKLEPNIVDPFISEGLNKANDLMSLLYQAALLHSTLVQDSTLATTTIEVEELFQKLLSLNLIKPLDISYRTSESIWNRRVAIQRLYLLLESMSLLFKKHYAEIIHLVITVENDQIRLNFDLDPDVQFNASYLDELTKHFQLVGAELLQLSHHRFVLDQNIFLIQFV